MSSIVQSTILCSLLYLLHPSLLAANKAAAVPSVAIGALAFLALPRSTDFASLTAVFVLGGLGNGLSRSVVCGDRQWLIRTV
jgi:hypothetical protein